MQSTIALFLCTAVNAIPVVHTDDAVHGRALSQMRPTWWLMGAICGGIVVVFVVIMCYQCWHRYRHARKMRQPKREIIRNMVRREVQLEQRRRSLKGVSRREYLRRT